MKIETQNGTLEFNEANHCWLVNEIWYPFYFVRALFPVEYRLIKHQSTLDRLKHKDNFIADRAKERAIDGLKDAKLDAECEVRWKAREDLSVFDDYEDSIK